MTSWKSQNFPAPKVNLVFPVHSGSAMKSTQESVLREAPRRRPNQMQCLFSELTLDNGASRHISMAELLSSSISAAWSLKIIKYMQ